MSTVALISNHKITVKELFERLWNYLKDHDKEVIGILPELLRNRNRDYSPVQQKRADLKLLDKMKLNGEITQEEYEQQRRFIMKTA